MSYKYETHLHTTEGSACGSSPAKDYVKVYADFGYSGFFVTDHFWGGNTCVNRDLPWEEWVNQYCSGYEHAYIEAEKYNSEHPDKEPFRVFFGFEQTFEGDDYLIYGLDRNWLLTHPEVVRMSQKDLFAAVNEAGALMIQAHPFRFRDYQHAIHVHPRDVHGVEVYNAGNKPTENDMAALYVAHYGFPVTSGSDIHNIGFITNRNPGTMAVGGMEFNEPLTCVQDYVDFIKNSKGKIIK